MSPDPRILRELQHAAQQATSGQLLRLTQTLDSLPQRAVAEEVMDSVRFRLRHLRPSRPLTLPRLLFLPLDPLLAAPREWRPGQGRIPRSAILPLAAHLRTAEPALVTALEAQLAGAKLTDHVLIAEKGMLLWPAAFKALPRKAPEGWEDAGLPAQHFAEVAGICAALWRHGPVLWRLRMAGRDGPPEASLRPAFRLIAAEGAEAVELCLGALLPYAAQPARMVTIVAGMSQAMSPPAERALDRYLTGVKPALEGADLAAMADAAERFARTLQDLDGAMTRDKPKRALQLQALRMSAAQCCTKRLEEEMGQRLTKPLAALLAAPAPSDAQVEALEDAAVALRGIGDSSRRLHASGAAERLFAPVIALLTAMTGRLPRTGAGFLRADALRLLEILAGTPVASRLG